MYGSSESIARHLRAFEGGKLNFSMSDNGQMFCPFQASIKNKPYQLQDTNIQYDTGYKITQYYKTPARCILKNYIDQKSKIWS